MTLVPACASQERSEGVVERWLLSLNQGAAGQPGRFGGAPAEAAADAVLPGWRTLDPGTLDEIEVGSASLRRNGSAQDVPFRLRTTDGRVIEGSVTTSSCDGGAAADLGGHRCIARARLAPIGANLSGSWSAGAGASAWIVALVFAAVFSAIAVGTVGLVRRRVLEG